MIKDTDRELLEKAAKAAGMKPETWFDGHNDEGRETGDYWNPLTDDGDALRLAVKLCLWVHIGKYHVAIDSHFIEEAVNQSDPCAATRRAIVRAAAAIGEAMPPTQGGNE